MDYLLDPTVWRFGKRRTVSAKDSSEGEEKIQSAFFRWTMWLLKSPVRSVHMPLYLSAAPL